jgi:hypothetical protein
MKQFNDDTGPRLATNRRWSWVPVVIGLMAVPAFVLAQTANGIDPAYNCKACIGPPDDQVCSYATCSSNQGCTRRSGTIDGVRWVQAVCVNIPAVP